jgi:hypothetical protein
MIVTTGVSEMFVFYDWQVQWTVGTSQLLDQGLMTVCNTIMTQVFKKKVLVSAT